jgi:serine/threonine protein kinase
MSWWLKTRLLIQVADAMAYLQQDGIAHTDLHPGNVHLTAKLDVKLTGFGERYLASRLLVGLRAETNGDTNDAHSVGIREGGVPDSLVLAYMAPELMTNGLAAAENVRNEQATIYAFGVTMWACMTRARPYDSEQKASSGSNIWVLRNQIARGKRPEVSTNPALLEAPTALLQLMQECWEADPAKRPFGGFAAIKHRLMQLQEELLQGDMPPEQIAAAPMSHKSSFLSLLHKSSFHGRKSLRPSVCQQPVLKEGYLEKQSSGAVKKWQSRYFEISGHYLNYYEKREARSEQAVKGAFDLKHIQEVSAAATSITIEVDDGSTVKLRSASEEVAKLWVVEIKQVVESLKATAAHSESVPAPGAHEEAEAGLQGEVFSDGKGLSQRNESFAGTALIYPPQLVTCNMLLSHTHTPHGTQLFLKM